MTARSIRRYTSLLVGVGLTVSSHAVQTAAGQPVWMPTGGPLGGDVNAIVATSDSTLFASSRHGGIFRSDDKGDTWTRTGATVGREFTTDLAVNSKGHIFAASSDGLRRSTNGGLTWSLLTDGRQSEPSLVVAVGKDDEVWLGSILDGVYRSVDNGDTWVRMISGLFDQRVVHLTSDTSGTTYAGTMTGLYRTQAGDSSWTNISGPLSGHQVYSVFVDRDGEVFAGSAGGFLYRKPSFDAAWEQLNAVPALSMDTTSSGRLFGAACKVATWTDDRNDFVMETPELPRVACLQDIETIGDTVFAATLGRGVFRSPDNGSTWEAVNMGLDATDILDLVFHKDGILVAGAEDGIHRSDDGGVTWSRHTEGLFDEQPFPERPVHVLLQTADGALLAGTPVPNHGLFRSIDTGLTWRDFEPGFQEPARALAQAPNGDLFVGSNGSVYRSRGGTGPLRVVDDAFGFFPVEALAASPSGDIFAASFELVRRSVDGGTTWEDLMDGLETAGGILDFEFLPDSTALALDPGGVYRLANNDSTWQRVTPIGTIGFTDIVVGADDTIYAGTLARGVVRSSDRGETWTSFDEGLNDVTVNVLALSTRASTGKGTATAVLAAGTRGGGVSILSPLPVAADHDVLPRVVDLELEPNYPNPFADITNIAVNLDRPALVSVETYDVLGRLVREDQRGRLAAGRHILQISGADLPPGTYVVVLNRGGLPLRSVVTRSAYSD